MASSRFGPSALHQRDPRSALFENYTGDRRTRPPLNSGSGGSNGSRTGSGNGNANGSPAPHSQGGYGYGYGYSSAGGIGGGTGGGGGGGAGTSGAEGINGGFRPATPNSRGQYSDAVLSELENQNEAQIEGMSAKVKMLKDITIAISSEITSSTSLAENMNNSFDNTRVRLRGTMNRMLRMAERTGVGWRAWLVFLTVVAGLFWWVWLF